MKLMQIMQKKLQKNRGVILLELLLAITAAAIIFSLGAQLTLVSSRSAKSAADITVAWGLLEETAEGARASTAEKWQNLFNVTKGNRYYAATSTDKWVINSGTQVTTVNGIPYTRYFVVLNVCRNQSTDAVTGITDTNGTATTCSVSGGSYDPSTQKITTTVSATSSGPISTNEYISRWRNKICNQTSWQTSGSSGAKTCPDTTYDSSTNLTTGTDFQLCSGGC